jgi:3-hydroxyisobutyrate dehydrogenase-like beta-hydroxyacid dehydrogenase
MVRVGFVGLGAMGFLMAKRLVDAGLSVKVWNRSSSKSLQFVSENPSSTVNNFINNN